MTAMFFKGAAKKVFNSKVVNKQITKMEANQEIFEKTGKNPPMKKTRAAAGTAVLGGGLYAATRGRTEQPRDELGRWK